LTKIVYLKINPIYLFVQFDKIFQQFLSRLLTLTISVNAVIMTRRSPSISWLILAGAPWPKMRRRREYRQPRSTAIAEDRGKGQTRLVHYRGRKSYRVNNLHGTLAVKRMHARKILRDETLNTRREIRRYCKLK